MAGGTSQGGFVYSGAARSFAIRIAGMGLVFISHVMLARALSAAEYGYFAYSLELIGLISVVAGLGMAQVAVQVVPDMRTAGNNAAFGRFFRAGVFVGLVGVSLAAVLLIAYWEEGLMPKGYPAIMLLATLATLASTVLLRFVQEIMRGLRHIASAQIVEQLVWPVAFVAVVGAAFTKIVDISIPAILAIQAIVFLGGFLWLSARAHEIVRHAESKPMGEQNTWQVWLIAGIPLAGSASLSVLLNRGDVIALGAMADADAVGHYAAAARVAALGLFGLAAANAASAPLMRELWMSGERGDLQSVLGQSAAIGTWFSLPLVLVCVAFPKLVLSLFGADFAAAAPALQILALGQFVNAMAGPVSPMLVAASRGGAYLAFTAIASILMIGLLLLLVPSYGTVGAALSAAGSISFLNVMLATYAWRTLGLRTVTTPGDLVSAATDVLGWLAKRTLAGKRT